MTQNIAFYLISIPLYLYSFISQIMPMDVGVAG